MRDTLPFIIISTSSEADVALLLDAMVGHHPRDPISLPRTETRYLDAVKSRTKPKKVAFSKDLGVTPVDQEVAEI